MLPEIFNSCTTRKLLASTLSKSISTAVLVVASPRSLTSVTFTPHVTSYDTLPTFECQKQSGGYCSPKQLGNCNLCKAKPESAWPYMSSLARKYLNNDLEFEYVESLFSMKPILRASEIDDSRPTVIKQFSEKPTFISVLSGKINTVYDLDEVLV